MLKARYIGLRAIEPDDLPQLLSWRNRPEFRRYFREYRELNSDMQRQWYETRVLNDPATRMFAIVDLAGERLLGACGLCAIDWINRSADFSIYIGADNLYIDEHFAPDAAGALIQYGFEELNLHRLWAEIYEFDTSKKRLFEHLGFHLDGLHKQTHWSNGQWHNSLFYGLIANEQNVTTNRFK